MLYREVLEYSWMLSTIPGTEALRMHKQALPALLLCFKCIWGHQDPTPGLHSEYTAERACPMITDSFDPRCCSRTLSPIWRPLGSCRRLWVETWNTLYRDTNFTLFLLGKLHRKSFHLHLPHWNHSLRLSWMKTHSRLLASMGQKWNFLQEAQQPEPHVPVEALSCMSLRSWLRTTVWAEW